MSDRMKVTFMNVNQEPDGFVVATLGFHILSMDLFLSKAKLIKKKDGSYFIAPPSEEYRCAKTGQIKYANFFWFGEKTSDFFQNEARKAINTFCKQKGIKNPMDE